MDPAAAAHGMKQFAREVIGIVFLDIEVPMDISDEDLIGAFVEVAIASATPSVM